MHVDGNVPPDKPPSALVASDVASAAQGLPLLRLRRYQVYCFTGAKIENTDGAGAAQRVLCLALAPQLRQVPSVLALLVQKYKILTYFLRCSLRE